MQSHQKLDQQKRENESRMRDVESQNALLSQQRNDLELRI